MEPLMISAPLSLAVAFVTLCLGSCTPYNAKKAFLLGTGVGIAFAVMVNGFCFILI